MFSLISGIVAFFLFRWSKVLPAKKAPLRKVFSELRIDYSFVLGQNEDVLKVLDSLAGNLFLSRCSSEEFCGQIEPLTLWSVLADEDTVTPRVIVGTNNLLLATTPWCFMPRVISRHIQEGDGDAFYRGPPTHLHSYS